MKVVSDTSPLINLARIGRVALLKTLFGDLLIPGAVWDEIVVKGEGQAGADLVRSASWIETVAVQNTALALALEQELDPGESEAIALALEAGADILLMDERLGRETAHHLGIRCVGLIGVLVAAKRRGLIDRVKPELDALRDNAGFWVHDRLYHEILRDLGETQD